MYKPSCPVLLSLSKPQIAFGFLIINASIYSIGLAGDACCNSDCTLKAGAACNDGLHKKMSFQYLVCVDGLFSVFLANFQCCTNCQASSSSKQVSLLVSNCTRYFISDIIIYLLLFVSFDEASLSFSILITVSSQYLPSNLSFNTSVSLHFRTTLSAEQTPHVMAPHLRAPPSHR